MAPTVVSPESVTWRVQLDRAMWVAGVRSLMLQALHPVAMQGVWQRSDFMSDPVGRLLRTADFVATTTYGSPGEAAELGRRVRAVHRRLGFVDPATGRWHRVDEPELLVWVHCAEVVSYLDVVRRAGVGLSADEADRYVAEQRHTATYVGLAREDVPGSVGELREYFAGMRPRLRAGVEARAAVRFLLWPKMPRRLRGLAVFKPVWAPVGALAYYSLPGWARREYGVLPEVPGGQAVVTVALRGVRAGLAAMPAVVYDRLFDPATVRRARRAQERLRAAGYVLDRRGWPRGGWG
ncbi:oxygenase MpaB family protein [Salinactinospora qingdaonensis]|uniref:Oxygenase MpaB family protein n=1 Tax=Salinactinospora qingdaonensis TaxID=702744 RepID=A0ABP7G3Z9_9ACTN